jgi:hypothetical protein
MDEYGQDSIEALNYVIKNKYVPKFASTANKYLFVSKDPNILKEQITAKQINFPRHMKNISRFKRLYIFDKIKIERNEIYEAMLNNHPTNLKIKIKNIEFKKAKYINYPIKYPPNHLVQIIEYVVI